ncbi:hypothetical protein [Roseimicrobium sp. ORNL1]|uniref:hypothetical protein n=1 Tax=Roseimicrobium sp. ORNL1 TaxID=2711231 RepID=UPI0013E1E704|nr:hypothetical protein [Roseimicrobium sp. ORNL1]QIF05168.1 hypothetical protein G5S37_27860 [Roseimicrobium sp. ORNL1]
MQKLSPRFLHCLVLCLVSACVLPPATAPAQSSKLVPPAEKAETGDWILKSYRYPAPPLLEGFDTIERGKLVAPPMPSREAGPDQIIDFLKRSHEVVNQHFRMESVLLPRGSVAVYDVENQTLAIRTTKAVHQRIEGLAESYMNALPAYLAFSVRMLEADGKTVREMLNECSTRADHQAALARLEGLVAQGQAKHLGILRADTRSGQRLTMTNATDFRYLSGQTVDGRDLAATTQETRAVGTVLEIDSVIAPDGFTIDAYVSLEHHPAPPTMKWVVSGQRGARAIESPVPDFHVAKVTTSVTLLSGMTKLLAVWNAVDAAGAQPADRLQVAFLKGDVVTIMPAPDERLERLLSAHGEKVEPTPKTLPPDTTDVPPGMELRSFRVPPSFLTVTGEPPVPTEPIDFQSPRWQDPRPTALEVLKAQGVSFPAGSYAKFNFSTSELVVCNTLDNLALVEAYTSALMRTNVRVLVVTVHVVQADGAVLRKVESETSNRAEHTAAWNLLESEIASGRAKVLRSSTLETRSGQRCTFQDVTECIYAEGSEYAKTSGEAGAGVGEKSGAVQNVTIATGGSMPLVTSFNMRPVGFDLDLDPVIGPDGITVDLNLTLGYDHTPPTTRREPLVADDKVFRFQPPGLEFHRTKLSTAFTMHEGQRRLLGIWKPTGLPEFENTDVMQAAFMKVDIVKLEYEGKKGD